MPPPSNDVNILTGMRSRLADNWLPAAVFIGIIALVAIFVPQFFQSSNLLNVGRQSAIIGVIAIGMTFVILTGGIDLSVGSILALSGVSMALMIDQGMVVPVAMVLAVLIGVGVGIVNGIGVAYLKVQPFIMTLATMVAFQGLSLRLTTGGPQSFPNTDRIFSVIGSGDVLGVPGPFAMFLLVSAAGVLALRYLAFGRGVYAVGGSLEAARLSGVRTGRTLLAAYAISGLCAGLAGIMTASRLGVGDPTAGGLANLDAITAVVIGGTSLMGGTGGAVGTVFGALLLAVLSNVMNLIGISPFDQQIVKGAVIVVAVLIAVQATRRRLRERGGTSRGEGRDSSDRAAEAADPAPPASSSPP